MTNPSPGLSLISKQVTDGDYYFMDLQPAADVGATVVCGGREVCGAKYEVDRKSFPFYSVEFVASGTGTLVLNGKTHALRPGSLFSYGPGISQRIATDSRVGMIKYFMDFWGEEPRKWLEQSPLNNSATIIISDPKHIQEHFDDIQLTAQREGPHAREICILLLRVLFLKISDLSTGDTGVQQASWSTFERCRSHFQKNFEHLQGLDDTARVCHVSKPHLCRLFRRYQKESAYAYLSRLKMARAATLFRNKYMLVKEAALRVGYDDPYHFSKVFKRHFGISPEHFRQGQANPIPLEPPSPAGNGPGSPRP